jgi:mediator of RNA polymerase II transcription subunit 25
VSQQLDELHQLEQQQMQLQHLHMQCQTVLEQQLLGPPSSLDPASALKQLQYRQQLEQQQRQAHAWALHDLLQQQEAEVQAREAELQATARAAGLSDLVLRELQQQVEAYELQAELLPQQLQQHAFQQQQAHQQQQFFQQQQQQQRRMLGSDAGLDSATKLQRLQAALRRGLLRQSLAAAASQNC